MFDLSWSEIIVILVVALLIIGPDELPDVIRFFTKIIRKVKSIAADFLSEIDSGGDLKKEAAKLNQDIKKIVDLEGNLQETYDISDIEEIDKSRQNKSDG